MERLAAEYLTLATLAQAERWDALLARSGLPKADVDAVRASDARGPLCASLRDAEARGLDVDGTFPLLVAARSFDDAQDVAAVSHGRVERWSQAARSRRQGTGNLIAGLIPRARRVSNPDLARALLERDEAMQQRARTLAEHAIEKRPAWLRRLGTAPADPVRREHFVQEVSVVAAYRDRWYITGGGPWAPSPTPPTPSNGSNARGRWRRPGGRWSSVKSRRQRPRTSLPLQSSAMWGRAWTYKCLSVTTTEACRDPGTRVDHLWEVQLVHRYHEASTPTGE